jgi:pilus assembly protein CpaF
MPPFSSAVSGTVSWSAQQSGRLGLSPGELSKRAHQRLAERIDLTKSKHKPLSILRQEARRVVEQYYEFESPGISKPERDQLVEEILGEAYGFGPLEELFRDDTAKEIMVLASSQVIVRRGENWLPTSVRFRDATQYRNALNRLTEIGESSAIPGTASGSGFDLKLSNGFRAIGILPPSILDQPPLVVFSRIENSASSGSTIIGVENRPAAATIRKSGAITNTPRSVMSGTTAIPVGENRQIPSQFGMDVAKRSVATPLPRPTSDFDPFAKIKQRVTERIVTTCAAAGMYDLSQIPSFELQKVVQAHVLEVVANERLSLDDTVRERLVVEILAAMNR